jgi:hypothetical protein
MIGLAPRPGFVCGEPDMEPIHQALSLPRAWTRL